MTAALPMVLPTATETRLPGILEVRDHDWLAWLDAQGEKPLRLRQLRRAVLARGAETFDAITDLPAALRARLAEAYVPLSSRIARHLQSADHTHKLLLELRDGNPIECVLIQEGGRRTACISTQVGCGMGCVFCASGINGALRN